MQLFTNLIASLVQREVGFAQQNSEGLSVYTVDLQIIQNDCITIPQSPLRGSSPLCTRGPFCILCYTREPDQVLCLAPLSFAGGNLI